MAPDVRPFDLWRCRSCGQLLSFDAGGRVPEEQLRACQGRCDWELEARPGPAAGGSR